MTYIIIYDNICENKFIDEVNRTVIKLVMPILVLLDNLHINPIHLKKFVVWFSNRYSRKYENSTLISQPISVPWEKFMHEPVFLKEDILPFKKYEFEGRRFYSYNNLEKIGKNIIKEKNTDVITLSGSMFILIQPEIIYLSSGNYEEYLRFNSQYLLQWMMIKHGIKNGFKKHNFYGIPADINTHPKDYGIYEFKRGFNGYVEELIGDFALPITWHYKLFDIIHKLKGR